MFLSAPAKNSRFAAIIADLMTATEYEALLIKCETTRLQYPPDSVHYRRVTEQIQKLLSTIAYLKKREAEKCGKK